MTIQTIRPLGDRVLIEPIVENQTAGGLFLPEAAVEKPTKGRVLAVGPRVEGVAAGDTVVFSKYGGFEFRMADKAVVVAGLANVFAVLG